jgi:guanosine-3',5'-bis(diphosphate) 3'-pyrophosphohydrolase
LRAGPGRRIIADKHRDQRRKNGDVPYVNHPLAVAASLAAEGGVRDPAVLAAAILHDTLEDTDATAEELERAFGPAVAGIVREVTDDRRLPKHERKRRQVGHARAIGEGARLVELADKLHNLRDLAQAPPPSWDAARVQGYFCWAHEVVQALGPANEPLWRALAALFASQLRVGGAAFRAVPEDPAERRRVLECYYAQMERTRD